MPDELEYSMDGNRLRVVLGNSLHEELARRIRGLLASATWDGIEEVALDFSRVVNVSSKDLGILALLCADEFFKARGLQFVGLHPEVYQSLCLVGIDQVVSVALPPSVQMDGPVVSDNARAIFHDCVQKACPVFGRKIVAYVKDAEQSRSELARLRQRLEKAQTQLIHSEKMGSLGQLAGGVAHEFNNLIAIMKGFVEMAQARPGDRKAAAKALEVVAETVDRAAKLTENLLSLSRRREPSKSRVDVNQLLAGQLDLMRNDCMASKVKVQTDFCPRATTVADGSQLQQVFLNLFTNALHAMPNGGTLRVGTLLSNGNIVITVTDTGCGIAPEHLQRIFTPFFTTKGAIGGGQEKGTGLGLSVSYGIIASHDGRIEVQSEVGKGTTFRILLPRIEGTAANSESARRRRTTIVAADRPLTVLVVDDEERIRQLISAAVEQMGHKVLRAVDGQEAVDICRLSRPDYVFLDMLMPRMNGGDAFLEIRRLHPQAGVTVVTGQEGKPLQAMLELMQRAGSVNLVRKPFSLHDIRQALRDFQARARGERGREKT